jgi:hypothetical protein
MTADPTPDPLKSDYLSRPDVQGHLRVLEVLREWDPIGVISESHRDEYDGYAPELIQMLDAGASPEFVSNWLVDMATNYMGLSLVDRRHAFACAKKLTDFWHVWKDRPQA